MQARIVVVGTGTGVGKTHIAAALTRELGRRRPGVAAGKPIESGVTNVDDSDAAILCRAAGRAFVAPLHSFAKPVSPHRAARKQGTLIELEPLVKWVDGLDGDPVVIETAGGLFSPLSYDCTNLELVLALAPAAIVLVGGDRLGALHDVRGCLRGLGALASRTVVVLSAPVEVDASSGTNCSELIGLGWTDLAVAFPRSAATSSETTLAARFLADAIEPRLPRSPESDPLRADRHDTQPPPTLPAPHG